jgi:hypothetical protein
LGLEPYDLQDSTRSSLAVERAIQRSAMGHLQTFCDVRAMSAFTPIADIRRCRWNVRKVPKADIRAEELFLVVAHTANLISDLRV